MTPNRALPASEVRDRLEYDPITGIFLWKINPSRNEGWNRRYAGQRAGSVLMVGGQVRQPRRLITLSFNGEKRRNYSANLAWLYMTGEWPSDEVDHKNTDSCDDRWDNLRAATSSQQKANRKVRSSSFTGLKGVSFDKRRGTYCADIGGRGKRVRASGFRTAEEAHAAYTKAAAELHGEFARAA